MSDTRGPRSVLQRKGFWKRKPPGPTARRRRQKRAVLVKGETAEKQRVRDRDVDCRFPLCGCKRGERPRTGHVWLTVSHDFHKGMGGDPTGGVSIASLMMLLCVWRHQEAPVSRHAGTMKTKYLTPDNNDGPVAFLVDLHAVYPGLYEKQGVWLEVARETYASDDPNDKALGLEPLTAEQEQVLNDLSEMTR